MGKAGRHKHKSYTPIGLSRRFRRYDRTLGQPMFNNPKIQRGFDIAKKWMEESQS